MTRGIRFSALLLGPLLLVSCNDGFVDPGPGWDASFGVTPSATSMTDYFEFLSPVVRSGSPLRAVDFDPNVLSVVEVCRLEGDACLGAPFLSFTRDTGIGVNEEEGYYQLNWKLNEPQQLAAGAYRLSVWNGSSTAVGTRQFGSVDFSVGTSREVTFDGGDSYNQTRNLPVKYRILKGALCETPDDSPTEPCFTSILTNEGGTFINEAREVGLRFEENSLPEGVEAVTLVIEKFEPTEDQQCLPTPFPQYENCYLIKTIPELAADFRINPVLDLCIDAAALDIIDQIDLYKFDGEDPATLEFVPRTDPAVAPILGCVFAQEGSSAMNSGWGARLVAPVLAFFQPTPAYARRQVRVSPTYDPRRFSRFGFVRPLEVEIVEGDNLTGVVNNEVVPSPTVRVTAAGNEVREDEPRIPAGGVPITFIAEGGASVSGGAEAVTVLTGGDGLASTTWRLGSISGDYSLTAKAFNPLGYAWPNLDLDVYTCDTTSDGFPYCEPADPGAGSQEKSDGPGALWGSVTFGATAVDVPAVAVRFLSPVEKGAGGGSAIGRPGVSVRICKGELTTPCAGTTAGTVSITPELKNNFYQGSWSTPGNGPNVTGVYTIFVLVDSRLPPDGFVHVEAARNANSAATSYYRFNPGQNVEIRFGLSAP